MRGLSLVAASGGHSSSRCAGHSLSRPLLLRSTGSRHAGSVDVAHGPSCSAACGIFPDQGSNPCPLCWQADSQPLHHQGSPVVGIFYETEFPDGMKLYISLSLASSTMMPSESPKHRNDDSMASLPFLETIQRRNNINCECRELPL